MDRVFVLKEISKQVMKHSADGAELPTPWWFTTYDGHGNCVTGASEWNVAHPLIEQQVFASELAEKLFRSAHHDGTWVVAFSAPGELSEDAGALVTRYYGRWFMAWFDKDCDLHFVADNDEPFAISASIGTDHFVDAAERVHDKWADYMAELEFSNKQQARIALGERAVMNGGNH